jgi:hypothetical protein
METDLTTITLLKIKPKGGKTTMLRIKLHRDLMKTALVLLEPLQSPLKSLTLQKLQLRSPLG